MDPTGTESLPNTLVEKGRTTGPNVKEGGRLRYGRGGTGPVVGSNQPVDWATEFPYLETTWRCLRLLLS